MAVFSGNGRPKIKTEGPKIMESHRVSGKTEENRGVLPRRKPGDVPVVPRISFGVNPQRPGPKKTEESSKIFAFFASHKDPFMSRKPKHYPPKCPSASAIRSYVDGFRPGPGGRQAQAERLDAMTDPHPGPGPIQIDREPNANWVTPGPVHWTDTALSPKARAKLIQDRAMQSDATIRAQLTGPGPVIHHEPMPWEKDLGIENITVQPDPMPYTTSKIEEARRTWAAETPRAPVSKPEGDKP